MSSAHPFISKGLDFSNTFSDNPHWVSLPGQHSFCIGGVQHFLKWWISHFGIKLNLVKSSTTNALREFRVQHFQSVCHAALWMCAACGLRRKKERYGAGILWRLLRHCEGREVALPCYQTSLRLLLSIKQTCLHTHPITTDQRHVARVVFWFDY